MHDGLKRLAGGLGEAIGWRGADAVRLAAKLLGLAIICYLSTEVGFAHKVPPHYISPLWPTNAILFGVLVVAPARRWGPYTLAAYFSSLVNDARAGFPVSGAVFLLADLVEVFIAAAGVRRFAGGPRAFASLRSLAAYLDRRGCRRSVHLRFRGGACQHRRDVLVLLARVVSLRSARILDVGSGDAHMDRPRSDRPRGRHPHAMRGGRAHRLRGAGHRRPRVHLADTRRRRSVPALVYLPLPLLLWAAVRFGSIGVSTSLLIIASLSISGAVHGRGPFASSTPAEGVLSLQLFLFTLSVPLMFLAALIEERREKTIVLRESEIAVSHGGRHGAGAHLDVRPGQAVHVLQQGLARVHWTNRGAGARRRLGSRASIPTISTAVFGPMFDAFDERRAFTMEYRLRRHDGDYRVVLDKGVPRHAADGTFLGYVGCADDITDLRRAMAEIRELKDRVELENAYLRQEITVSRPHEGVVGESAAIKRVLSQVEQVAGTAAAVLLLGETGVGKELIARALHRLSQRHDRALVKVNCAALPSALVESELFGREKGAYTGALTRQAGRFEVANGSTIFLDEIGELPLELQAKLLRVLQDGELERLGSTRTIKVDVRVIAATNRDLANEIRAGRFREDLFYRLNVFPIAVPPLRERQEDIPLLVWAFVREFEVTMGKRIETIPRKSLDALVAYPWPGNVRELRNVIERAMIVSSGAALRVEIPAGPESLSPEDDGSRLAEVERRHILAVLERARWRIRGPQGAANVLGLKPTTLEARMAKLGIKRAPGASSDV